MKSPVVSMALALVAVLPAAAQHPAPGEQGSRNVRVLSHVPMGRSFSVTDVEVEQELSRPYAYVSRMLVHGMDIIDLKDPANAKVIWSWKIENPDLHQGNGGMDNKYFKLRGRYYDVQTFQFQPSGPNSDLGAVLFDVTGLPHVSTVKEAGRMRAPDTPGGFHNVFAYKHSDGRVLLFATTTGRHANIYDMERFLNGDANQGFIGRVPIPENPQSQYYHDFYIAYDPASRQDRFYGAAQPLGSYIYDVTRPEEPKLITSLLGAAGHTRDHTFVVTPDGRYGITESHLPYRPLMFWDLKPGLEGQAPAISRPIGAWTSNWKTNMHNMEIRWPYVFVAGYENGVQIVNMMDPTNPYTVGYYDTYGGPSGKGFGGVRDPEAAPGFFSQHANGAFGIDVRNADGLVVVGDFRTGFWTLKMDGFDGWNGRQWGMPNASSAQDWDNGPDGAPRPQRIS